MPSSTWDVIEPIIPAYHLCTVFPGPSVWLAWHPRFVIKRRVVDPSKDAIVFSICDSSQPVFGVHSVLRKRSLDFVFGEILFSLKILKLLNFCGPLALLFYLSALDFKCRLVALTCFVAYVNLKFIMVRGIPTSGWLAPQLIIFIY